MTAYVPSDVPRKKAYTLERREEELLNRIANFGKSEALHDAAEKVRQAQIGYLKARLYHAEIPSNNSSRKGKKIRSDIEKWQTRIPDDIIDFYIALTKRKIRRK